MPWPFRPSWPSPANQFGTSDSADVDPSLSSPGHKRADDAFPFPRASPGHSPIDSPFASFHSADDVSCFTQWAGNGNVSSTCIPQPKPAHLRTQQPFYPYQLLHGHTVFGQAITSDEEIHMSASRPAGAGADDNDDVIWPFTSETQASGRDPIRRSRSDIIPHAYAHAAGASRTLSHHRSVSRNQSRLKPRYHTIEGGWI
ncbi:hypothetical protein F5Y14DRAFT_436861 [Nemania sp. NC0429]|nr:hypothetical protein F5Y14DRAFT_436861 [Nemania sp. NC0429]